MAFVFAEDFLAEVLLEVLSYYEHDFAEAGLHGVVDRVVHYSFAVRAQPVELFQSAVTAAMPAASSNKVGFMFLLFNVINVFR